LINRPETENCFLNFICIGALENSSKSMKLTSNRREKTDKFFLLKEPRCVTLGSFHLIEEFEPLIIF
jgi:hypothetical protein